MPDELGLDSIMFDTFTWTPGPSDAGTRRWEGEGTVLLADFIPMPPDLPSLDAEELRAFYEAAATGGDASRRGRWFRRSAGRSSVENRTTRVIEVSVGRDGAIPVVRAILRLPLPDRYAYSAALTLPLAECSWVIQVQAAEEGITGVREAVALDHFLRNRAAEGEASGAPVSDAEALELTAGFDPYETRWDGLVNDPLSSVRRHIVLVEHSLAFAPEVLEARPFR